MPDIDIAVWTHEQSDRLSRAIASIGKYCQISCNIILVCEPGTVPENMQRVLDRSRSRFLFFMEDDVELLDRFVIKYMSEVLSSREDVGAISPNNLQSEEVARNYEAEYSGYKRWPAVTADKSQRRAVVPATFMFDLEKLPNLYIEHGYKDPKFFRDADLCHQVLSHGLWCLYDWNFSVFHNHKKLSEPIQSAEFIESKVQYLNKWDIGWPPGCHSIPGNLNPKPIAAHNDA